jgi:hypothetical protein
MCPGDGSGIKADLRFTGQLVAEQLAQARFGRKPDNNTLDLIWAVPLGSEFDDAPSFKCAGVSEGFVPRFR